MDLFIQDNTDHQYASFRRNLPLIAIVMIVHQIVSNIISTKFREYQKKWSLLFSIVFIFALFGLSALKVLGILSLYYVISQGTIRSKLSPFVCWMIPIGTLFLNDFFKGYSFASIHYSLEWMDNIKGAGVRWNILFNFTILRMISFHMDKYWALNSDTNKIFEDHQLQCNECQGSSRLCRRQRMEKPLDKQAYSFTDYLVYCLYAPLYMAGPIISFNDFMHQKMMNTAKMSIRETLKYGIRWAGAVLLMEIMMHTFYIVAIKETKAWKGYSPLEIFLVGFFNLKMIWLKLLIIWRFFRLWAMSDGVETVENMGRCMSNHYSGIDFWRTWHSSFNRWIVRYMYVPLGGSKFKGVNVFPIFTFVAIWHDIEGRLLAWGWLIALFILPELIGTRIFLTPQVRSYFGGWHLHLCAFAGAFNVFLMMFANLVGFAVGIEGILEMSDRLFHWDGDIKLMQAFSSLLLLRWSCLVEYIECFIIDLKRKKQDPNFFFWSNDHR